MRAGPFSFLADLSIPIEVAVRVTGTWSPAVTSGPPDDWAPEEYEDEREIEEISIGGQSLPADLVRRLAPYLQEAVNKEEIDVPRE